MQESFVCEIPRVEKNNHSPKTFVRKRHINGEVQCSQVTCSALHFTEHWRDVWSIISQVDKKQVLKREPEFCYNVLKDVRWECRWDCQKRNQVWDVRPKLSKIRILFPKICSPLQNAMRFINDNCCDVLGEVGGTHEFGKVWVIKAHLWRRWYAKGATKIAKRARALDQSVALWGSESAIRG